MCDCIITGIAVIRYFLGWFSHQMSNGFHWNLIRHAVHHNLKIVFAFSFRATSCTAPIMENRKMRPVNSHIGQCYQGFLWGMQLFLKSIPLVRAPNVLYLGNREDLGNGAGYFFGHKVMQIPKIENVFESEQISNFSFCACANYL